MTRMCHVSGAVHYGHIPRFLSLFFRCLNSVDVGGGQEFVEGLGVGGRSRERERGRRMLGVGRERGIGCS